jgi:hypothetical protein
MQSRKLLKEQLIYIRDKRNADENNTSVFSSPGKFYRTRTAPLTDRRTNSPAYLSEL